MVDHHQPLYWGHMQNWILTKVKKNSLRKKNWKRPDIPTTKWIIRILIYIYS